MTEQPTQQTDMRGHREVSLPNKLFRDGEFCIDLIEEFDYDQQADYGLALESLRYDR